MYTNNKKSMAKHFHSLDNLCVTKSTEEIKKTKNREEITIRTIEHVSVSIFVMSPTLSLQKLI